jgi:hypothetical protein
MKADTLYQAETQAQNIYQLFEDYLDALYFEGYANQLAEENPQAYEFELIQFSYNF